MKCPECDGKLIVVDTRFNEFMYAVLRKRKCNGCGAVFHTVEKLNRNERKEKKEK